MFLTNPQRSPADLNFRIFDIPVRVHPLFWVMGIFIGFPSLQHGIANLLVWVGCMFVSVLVHEFGHVVTARMFGVWSEIVLYGLGGLAIQSSRMRNRWQHILVCLAGPGAGFLFLGLVLLCLPLAAPQEWAFIKNLVEYKLGLARLNIDLIPDRITLVWEMFWALFLFNVWWGILNLLPIWPLDGGQVSRDVFEWLMPRGGVSAALGISLVCSGLLTANAVLAWQGHPILPRWVPAGDFLFVLLFGLLAIGSFQALQEEHSRSKWTDEHWTRWDDER
jgi:Zn-dependent protease